jgi:hypothetical protein
MNTRNPGSFRLFYLMFAILVIGTKLLLVASYGSSVPVWDQWDAEIDRLFRPWMEGTLHWQDLLAAHNEHRVFTGRLLALSLFLLNGRVFDPMLEMAVNALLHTGALLLLLYGLLMMFREPAVRKGLVLFSTFLFCIPFGVENLLANNSSFYFVILFSMVFLIALSRRIEGDRIADAVALLSGLLACLSFASGALTLVAGAGLLLVQWATGVRRDRWTVFMMLLFVLASVVFIVLTPSLPGHDHHKSRSIVDFVVAILKMTGGLVFFIPSILFMRRQFREKPRAGDPSWFLFALCIWFYGQMFLIAYGRGHSNVLTSRYRDLYSIGYLANLAALLCLPMRNSRITRSWLVALLVGIGAVMPVIARELRHIQSDGVEYEMRVSSYLATHEKLMLFERGAKIPYPDPERLNRLLDSGVVLQMLPTELSGTDHPAAGKPVVALAAKLSLTGTLLAGAGFGILVYLFFLQALRFSVGEHCNNC